jgi:plasmid stabilization system protein ParE
VPEEQDAALRELLVGSYRVIYEVHSGEVVEILMVWHGARTLPELPDT